ncbi:MAG: 5'/3'-nucleotidase SurE [Bacteroidetes bacterium]|nr:5'/3'-nucleotidase SurE [Bacteroidota bacterium]
MTKQKLILVTNDDGIHAKGIHALVSVAKKMGRVVVVAPDKPQSGMGHAITIHHPLRIKKLTLFDGIEAYSCSGTPVDCVKLGIYEVLQGAPDLILSGINHGENSSTNVLYSGTMSAAIEGAMENIPSIGFSLCDYNADADFSSAVYFAEKLIQYILKIDFPSRLCLNVNIPNIPKVKIKGIKICSQAHAYWADRFEKRLDQFGEAYYWLTGDFTDQDQRVGTDLHALKNDFVSVVPTHFDLTAHAHLPTLKNIENV